MIIFPFLGLLILAFLIHSIFPTYYHKLKNPNIVRHTNQENRIMLTFDDGPDERYTNHLLDVLAEHDVKATFFVVAKNAQENPAIIKRMQKEQHIIGLHSLEHKNAMLFSSRYTKKDFAESLSIMNNMGCKISFYRPPWGHTNLFSVHFMSKYNLNMILWDVMAEDWQEESTVQTISTKLMVRTKNNSIICLHDAGENSGGAIDAPLKTIAALDKTIPLLKEKGFQFVTPEGILS